MEETLVEGALSASEHQRPWLKVQTSDTAYGRVARLQLRRPIVDWSGLPQSESSQEEQWLVGYGVRHRDRL